MCIILKEEIVCSCALNHFLKSKLSQSCGFLDWQSIGVKTDQRHKPYLNTMAPKPQFRQNTNSRDAKS